MTFYDFLMAKCQEYTHALDDDLPDVFESWIVDRDLMEIINWAEEWKKTWK